MFVIKQNCGKKYECNISALEAYLSLDARIVYIQEPFFGQKNLAHWKFNQYLLAGM